MTVVSSTSKSGPFAGNGSTTVFAFNFRVLQAADIKVVRTVTANGAQTDSVLGIGTHYTVTLNADQSASPGGSVTMLTAPAPGHQITILRNMAATQGVSIPNQGGFYPRVVEQALDKLTMLVQQALQEVSLAVKSSVADPSPITYSDVVAQANLATSAATQAKSAIAAIEASATAAAASAADAATKAAAATTSAAFVAGLVSGGVISTEILTTEGQYLIDSIGYHSEYFNAPTGSMFILPDARKFGVGFCYEIYSVNTAVLMANDGTYLGSANVLAGLTRLWLVNNSTQAGVWAITPAVALTSLSATSLNGTLVTITSSLSSLNPQVVQVPLDSTRTLVVYSTTKASSLSTSGIWAVVVTSSYALGRPAVSVGTPVQISGGANIGTDTAYNALSVCSVGTDLTAIGWMESNNSAVTPKVAVIQTNGATATAGAPQALKAAYAVAAFSGPAMNAPAVSLCSPAAGVLFAAYFDGASRNVFVRGISVSGTSLTLNTEYTAISTSTTAGSATAVYAAAHSATVIAVATTGDPGATNTGKLVIASVSGANVASVGSVATLANTQTMPVGIIPMSGTSGVLVTNSSTNSLYAYTISGTALTIGSPVANASGSLGYGIATSASSFSVVSYSNSYGGYNYTVSGTIISAASPATFTAGSTFGGNPINGFQANGAYKAGNALVFPYVGTVVDAGSLVTRSSSLASGAVGATITANSRYVLNASTSGGSTVSVRAVLPTISLT